MSVKVSVDARANVCKNVLSVYLHGCVRMFVRASMSVLWCMDMCVFLDVLRLCLLLYEFKGAHN